MSDLLIFSSIKSGQEEPQYIDPFSYELVERLASHSDKNLWEKRWMDFPELPRHEDGLVDFISRMNIIEFLRFFSPLMNGH